MDSLNPKEDIYFQWRPRSLYFTVFLWISFTQGRFLAPFLEHEASLSASQIGTLLAIHQGTKVLTSSVAGSWADAMERRYPGRGRAIVMALGVTMGALFFLLHGMARIAPQIAFLQSTAWYGLLRICYSASTSFIFPVMDGICLEFLKGQPGTSAKDYGKERLYGAVSWAVTNLFMGPGLDYFGFTILYPLTILSTVILLATIAFYTGDQSTDKRLVEKRRSDIVSDEDDGDRLSANNERQDKNEEPQMTTISLLRMMIMSWFGVPFLFAVVTLSSGQAVVENFVFLFFEFLGSSYLMMGVTVVLTVAFEIPIFQIAPTLLDKLGSGVLLLVASVAYMVRVIGYSLVPKGKVGYVLLLEPLHGVTYGCSATAGVDFMSSMVPPGYEASGQGLLQVFVGTGSILGLLMGGWVEETLGPRIMYRIAATVVLIGSSIFACFLYYGRQPGPVGHEQISQNEDEDEEMTDLSTDLSTSLSSSI
jgi:Na+/melibiose symporter-like transporter